MHTYSTRFRHVALLCFLLAPTLAFAADDLSTKPITTTQGELGDLLRKWAMEGTAAGNVGDWYDNRDGGHSDLDTSPWPQVQRIVYSDDDKKAMQHWAAQHTVLEGKVVFGNSSTSAGVYQTGSNVRSYYAHPRGLPFLYAEYSHNNLYMYPEHNDHDPGHQGDPGFGDLYPTNTPFLITSQGSSGSDQPFMRAIPYTLAAFRPEVKRKLVETGLLMPTVQMIFRASNKHLKTPEEYLAPKAHPTVFEGSWVDELKMVKLAHEIEPATIPPMVQLKVVEEEKEPTPGVDFFDVGVTEKLADTPAVISRIWRSLRHDRKMVVSAETSFDVNKHPLKYHWVVLRGDPAQISIKPRGDTGAVAEISLSYPARRPVIPGSEIESNRVDIGVFVHNGTYFSAPGFITFFALDNEARTFDDKGRIAEVGYGMGQAFVTLPNWTIFFETIGSEDASTPASKLLRTPFKPVEMEIIRKAAGEYAAAQSGAAPAREKQTVAQKEADQASSAQKQADEAVLKSKATLDKTPGDEAKAALATAEAAASVVKEARTKADEALRLANDALNKANNAAEELLTKNREGLEKPIRPLVEARLSQWVRSPTFLTETAELLAAAFNAADENRRNSAAGIKDRLVKSGLADAGDPLKTTLKHEGTSTSTTFANAALARFQAELLAQVLLPAGVVNADFRENLVDFRLTAPKHWRDVYRYTADGTVSGWTRYEPDGHRTDFDPDGLAVLERDAQGRRKAAHAVTYEHERAERGPIKAVFAAQIFHYAYENDADRVGRVARIESQPPK